MSTPDHTPAPAVPSAAPAADVQAAVADSADAADLFGTAPALLLELQTAVGALAAAASRLTERGRRPFRPDDVWATALGDVAYRAYLLADQTGVQLDRQVQAVADRVRQDGAQSRAAGTGDAWVLGD